MPEQAPQRGSVAASRRTSLQAIGSGMGLVLVHFFLMLRTAWLLFVLTIIVTSGCTRSGDPELDQEFVDDFDRRELGDDWRNTGGPYEIVDGELHVAGAKNHPLWLKRRLPQDLRVSFTARSESTDGDIKFELFGDGVSSARQASYVATGYVLIFGGWHNSKTIIARRDEHGPDVKTKRGVRVVKGKQYQFKAERRGGLLRWWIDDELMLELDDVVPLKGKGHDHFGFNNWSTPLFFDNFRVTPL